MGKWNKAVKGFAVGDRVRFKRSCLNPDLHSQMYGLKLTVTQRSCDDRVKIEGEYPDGVPYMSGAPMDSLERITESKWIR
jgi:hypothetical protein